MRHLPVNEIFVSLQGESSWAGYPCCFVRLAGCNLRCRYCDTPGARTESASRPMSVAAIARACRESAAPLLAVTGGEPLRQSLLGKLVDALTALPARAVLVETNGSYDIRAVPEAAITVMDVKCPASGAAESMDWENLKRLRAHDEVKFVLCDRADYAFALETVRRHRLLERCGNVLFAPAAGRLAASTLARWLIDDRPGVRLQCRLHSNLHIR